MVFPDDARFNDGTIFKRKMEINNTKAVDMYGNIHRVNKEDIRIKSGELKKVYHVPIIIIDDITYKNWNHASKELNLPRKEIMKRCYSQIEYFNYIVLPRK